MTPQERVAQGVVEGPVALAEAVVHYQRCGDGPGVTWAQHVLAHAAGEEDITDDWSIYGAWQAGWVEVIVFTFRTHVPCDDEGGVPYEDLHEWLTEMAAEIVGESDVQVLGVKVIDGPVTP